jgi:uncharacterized membrane protein (UPF0127 family)
MKYLRVVITLCLALLLSAQSYDMNDLDAAFGKDAIVISADEYACWHFDVYVASSREQLQRGLMFVRDLPEFVGMIFVYTRPSIHSMWMKNTFIPLDMLFIKGDGTVSSVVADTTPHSLESIASVEPVNFVLELNAGMTAKLAIGTSSRVLFMNLD